MHRREFLEHLGVSARAGLCPLHHRQPQLVEEHGAHLERRGDREGMPCQGVNLRLERDEPVGILRGKGSQRRQIDPHAPVFHGGEHHGQWHLQLGEELGEARLCERRRQADRQFPPNAAGSHGLCRVGRLVEDRAVTTVRHHDADIDAVAEAHLREAQVPFARIDQIGSEHRVECTASQFDPHGPQRQAVSLEIVAGLGNRRVGQQPAERGAGPELVGRHPGGDSTRRQRQARRWRHAGDAAVDAGSAHAADGDRGRGPQPRDDGLQGHLIDRKLVRFLRQRAPGAARGRRGGAVAVR